ncbi:vomeronasal type-1 receptor 4-like [Phyllostomus hastatus]|uniref:vomeronasal type-1 receptor 4-like n=1 Tax=Phyllostomus hastatus TaxID=9423 RepID=UPI001E67F00D|nr:vomeronasal type-1 receptor 4-like [Phyllostomus hastatus]
MATKDFVVGMTFLLQTVIGVLGNFSLLYHYLFLHFTGCRLRPTDLMVINLIVANSLVLFSTGIHYTMSSFGRYHHLHDFGCKFFPYLRGVGRGVSIGTTCLLSIFQAITISPMNSRWADLKVKAPKYIVFSVFLYWVLQMLVNVIVPIFMSSNLSNKNITDRKLLGFCSHLHPDKTKDSLFAVLLTSPDVVCFMLMLWASGSMVFILHRHRQRVRHVHRTPVSSRSSPVSRATKTILLLVSTFVFFNTLSSIVLIVISILNNPSLFLPDIYLLINLCFPTVSPFLLMIRGSSVSRLSFAWIRNVKCPNLMGNI